MKKEHKKSLALFQIFIFVISTLSFAYLVGNEIGVVKAQTVGEAGIPDYGLPSGIEVGAKTATDSLPLPVSADISKWEAGIPDYGLPDNTGAVQTSATAAAASTASTVSSPAFDVINPTKISIIDAAWHTLIIGLIAGTIAFVTGGKDWQESWFWAQAFGGAWGAGEGAQIVSTPVLTWVAENWLKIGTDWVPEVGLIIRIVTTLYTFWVLSRRANSRQVLFQCGVWQPQTKGNDCDLCNHQEFKCTDYQCRSLGQGCSLINADTSEPRCIWKDQDKTPPVISPWQEILTPGYSYEKISEKAYSIVNATNTKDKCLTVNKLFTFGVALDKLGACKIADHLTKDFTSMDSFMNGDTSFTENHSQTLKLPGGNYEYYVRCSNVNGNTNSEEFEFKFCIEEGADIRQPTITGFSLLDKTPITYFDESSVHEIAIETYTDEESKCKWDVVDRSYEQMENSLGGCTTGTSVNYLCSGTLTGLENEKENKFYFRCMDTAGNVMTESKPLTLIGTKPLSIDSVEPTEGAVIKGSSNKIDVTLKAKTSGYKGGEAICLYSKTGEVNDYIKFDNTQSYQSDHVLSLVAGSYHYYIKCVDMGGNIAQKDITFTVETDFTPPVVTRAYNDNGKLKIVTNENASCVYSKDNNIGCGYNFEDGLKFTTSNNIEHTIPWDTKNTFYIKCKDDYGNYQHGDCSITIRPFQSY